MAVELEFYSGKLIYKDIEFDFVFAKSELRLIPPKEKLRETHRWFMKKLEDGAYVDGDPVYIEVPFLKATINETGQTIVFFPSYSQVGYYNYILTISIDAYMLNKSDVDEIDRIGFKSTEIDYIYSTKKALYWPNWDDEGTVSIKTTKFDETTSDKQIFSVDGKTVSVYFGITRTTRVKEGEPPLELHSIMYFEFEKTNDYSFLIKLWHIAKSFIQYLCYRQNVGFPKAEISAPAEDGKHKSVATLYIINDDVEVESNTLSKGRYIKQSHIAGYEGKILEDIANNKLYQQHIPLSYAQGRSIDAARFVMIMAAFEWEFNRCYPDGVPKKASAIEAEKNATTKLDELISSSSGRLKNIYKFLKKLIKSDSLQHKIEQVGKDYANIIDVFGKHLYSLNGEILKYNEMGERIADQRNHFAHGDLDKDFIGNSLLDLIFLEYVIYTIQLKSYGISDENIKHIINELFHCSLAI